jgi:hypothetical protein
MNFYEMSKLLELAQVIGKNDPVPLSQIPPRLASTAVTAGEKDGEKAWVVLNNCTRRRTQANKHTSTQAHKHTRCLASS